MFNYYKLLTRDVVARLVRTLGANCHAPGFDARRRGTVYFVIKCGTGCWVLSPVQVLGSGDVKSGGELMGVDMLLNDAKLLGLHIMSSLDAYATFSLMRGFFEHQALFYNALAQPLSRVEVVEKIVKLGTVTLETHTNMFQIRLQRHKT
ncbi:hypothetical protein Bca101_091927 [Brassica carinata]